MTKLLSTPHTAELAFHLRWCASPADVAAKDDVAAEDGFDRPFFCILETPGSGNVVRCVNTAPVEFPMTAAVVPHSINDQMGGGDVVIGGDAGW